MRQEAMVIVVCELLISSWLIIEHAFWSHQAFELDPYNRRYHLRTALKFNFMLVIQYHIDIRGI